jgi:hypothetical protein
MSVQVRPEWSRVVAHERAAREALLVARMERRMTKELRANRHKTPWTELPAEYLLSELRGHVDKLAADGSWEHAADVANLAAMVADRWEPQEGKR